MRTRAMQPGDLVLVDHLGRVFYARVAGLERARVLAIEPLDRRVSYRSGKAREVIEDWTHAGRGGEERPPRAQLQLEVAT